jgi:Nif-specific regulatory protein
MAEVMVSAYTRDRAGSTIPRAMADTLADQQSAILLAVGGVLHREIAIDELMTRLVDHISETMDADRGTIYLLDRGKGELLSRAAHLPELDEIRLQIGQGVAGYVAQTGEVLNVPAAEAEQRFYEEIDRRTGYRTETILAAPMRDHAGNVIGVVQLLNKRSGTFGADEGELLTRLADQAALAIEATTMYEDLARAPASQLAPLGLQGQFNRIIGESEHLRAACRLTAKAAASQATVLILGESGTGKELFARAIHVNSPRADMPFVKVDCAALPESLIENELFGHERGAYTSADELGVGKFDVAAGGTIFLDEIGELPPAVQGKLLRVLQDREFLRVGGTTQVQADVRVVVATNRNLEQMVRDGRFRSDLYFRIKVVEIGLPPLRKRGDKDITRLARHFAASAAKRHGRPVPTISAAALERLHAYRWPGNVRELENCLESTIVVMDGNEIGLADLPLPDTTLSSAPHGPESEGDRILTLDEVERRHVLSVLAKVAGNQTTAAKLLGIGRNTLSRKLKKWT